MDNGGVVGQVLFSLLFVFIGLWATIKPKDIVNMFPWAYRIWGGDPSAPSGRVLFLIRLYGIAFVILALTAAFYSKDTVVISKIFVDRECNVEFFVKNKNDHPVNAKISIFLSSGGVGYKGAISRGGKRIQLNLGPSEGKVVKEGVECGLGAGIIIADVYVIDYKEIEE